MTFSTRKLILALVVVATMVAMSTAASAQARNSGPQTINLMAHVSESLTLTLSGNTVNFTPTAGRALNAGDTTISATTSWNLRPGRTVVTVNAYFTSAVALTDGAGNNIPTSAFTISFNGGTPTALVNGNPYSGNGYPMQSIDITGTNRVGSSTDQMAFNIDLSSMPLLPAGDYTGVLNIQAQATP